MIVQIGIAASEVLAAITKNLASVLEIRLLLVTLLSLIPQFTFPYFADADESKFTGVWNGFLNQINVIECHNGSAASVDSRLFLVADDGSILTQTEFSVPSRGSVHTVVNGLNGINISDAFGSYVVERLTGERNLFCHTAFYRMSEPGSAKGLEYAFSVPAGNDISGVSWGGFNSIHPGGESVPVANWLSIINLHSQAQAFEIQQFNMDGNPGETIYVAELAPGKRRDVALGHPDGQVIGTFRIIPQSDGIYQSFLSRYSRSNGTGYQFAFPLIPRSPSCAPGPVEASTFGHAVNWGEIINTADVAQTVQIEITKLLDNPSAPPYHQSVTIPARGQYHVPLHEILGTNNVGSLRVNCEGPTTGGVVVQSLLYGRQSVDRREVEWAYGAQPQVGAIGPDSRAILSVNTNLGAANWGKLSSQDGADYVTSATFYTVDGIAPLAQGDFYSLRGKVEIALHERFEQSQIGLTDFEVNANQGVAAEVIRVFYRSDGEIGTIMRVPAFMVETETSSTNSSDNSSSSSNMTSSASSSSTSSTNSSSSNSMSSGSSQQSSSSSSSISSSSSSTSSSVNSAQSSMISISRNAVQWDGILANENTLRQLIIKPEQGSPAILSALLEGTSSFRVLSSAEVQARGGIPCSGALGNFCSLMLDRTSSPPTLETDTLTVTVEDVVTEAGGSHAVALLASPGLGGVPIAQFRTVSVTAAAAAAGLTPLAYLNAQLELLRPTSFVAEDPLMFDSYVSGGTSDWSNNWTNSSFDFSGIAWDAHQAGTAITRCHVVYAKHYPRSGQITFHRKSGERFVTNLTGRADLPGFDITVRRLEPCLPENWKIYPLVSSTDNLHNAGVSGAPYVNTHYNVANSIRRLSVTQIGSVYSSGLIYGTFNSSMPSEMQVTAQTGDSGNPSFLVVDGELVLTSTFTYGGYGGGGPFYGNATLQSQLNTALAALP